MERGSRRGKKTKRVRIGISSGARVVVVDRRGQKSHLGADGARPDTNSARRVINLQPSGPDDLIVRASGGAPMSGSSRN